MALPKGRVLHTLLQAVAYTPPTEAQSHYGKVLGGHRIGQLATCVYLRTLNPNAIYYALNLYYRTH